jgi:multiple sugar transport system permease protein
MGYASAMAWILFLVILACTVVMLRVSERYTYYSG